MSASSGAVSPCPSMDTLSLVGLNIVVSLRESKEKGGLSQNTEFIPYSVERRDPRRVSRHRTDVAFKVIWSGGVEPPSMGLTETQSRDRRDTIVDAFPSSLLPSHYQNATSSRWHQEDCCPHPPGAVSQFGRAVPNHGCIQRSPMHGSGGGTEDPVTEEVSLSFLLLLILCFACWLVPWSRSDS